jgi:hypothetical protein
MVKWLKGMAVTKEELSAKDRRQAVRSAINSLREEETGV